MTDAIHSVPYSVLVQYSKRKGQSIIMGRLKRWNSEKNNAERAGALYYAGDHLCDVRHSYKNIFNDDSHGMYYTIMYIWRTDNVTCLKCRLVIKAIQRGDI